ncbi:bifunctional molybdenum cofactor biosynthesis protein MoaC/MogA [bacterium BMS3Abin07]|nr:bifunctional molybdenum cofactor biosynthesis protein MoaC/MogA [bacterium BMS3Abin07]HDO22481.1 hypothetical protein [Nitrospirota bacterium]
MCDIDGSDSGKGTGIKTIPVDKAVGTVLAHDITEIRPGEFKGRAFRKGHVVRREDVCHLRRLGKENLFVLNLSDDEMHENDAAYVIAEALKGGGAAFQGEPREGKINLIAERDGILKIDRNALFQFNMTGEVMCATLHNNTIVKKGQVVAGTRAIPLVVKKTIVKEAVDRVKLSAGNHGSGVIQVLRLRKPRVGIVITGNEVYYGKIKDAFAPVIEKEVKEYDGEVVGIYYAPDEAPFIEARLRELIGAGADLLITTGGMSVDPDDVTRFAIRNLGAAGITYGSPVLPGAMFLVAYVDKSGVSKDEDIHETDNSTPGTQHSTLIPILGIPACGMYASKTIFDLIFPRVLAGEKIGRRELAELGHGGLCLKCDVCRFPVCPFGK